MKKIARVTIFCLLTIVMGSQSIMAQVDEFLKEVNFDETEGAMKDVDVSAYLRDITGDLEAFDEKYTADSTVEGEKYVAYRLQKVQELINKPASDCMTKYDLIGYKGTIFSEVSLKGLNPFILKLRAMAKTKKDEKKAAYDQMVLDYNEAVANAEKSESVINLKLIKTVGKGKIDSIYLALNALYAIDVANINVLADRESAKNMSIRNSLEPVEGTKAGKEACFKIQIKKPQPVQATTVSTTSETSTESEGSGENGENSDSYSNSDTSGSGEGTTNPDGTINSESTDTITTTPE